ncbi:Tap42 interacting protein [Thecaphora frezii]
MHPTRAPFAGAPPAATTAHAPLNTTTTTTTRHAAPTSTATSSSSGSGRTNTTKARGITLGGWSIRVTSGNIGSSAEMDALSDLLGIPPPEMAFPHNSLVLHHAASGFRLCFDAVRALQSVEGVKHANALHGIDCRDSGPPASSSAATAGKARKSARMGEKPKGRGNFKGIKVSYANEWGKKRHEAQLEQKVGQDDVPIAAAATVADESQAGPPQGQTTESTSHFGPEVAMAVAASGIALAKEYDWTYSSTWAGAEWCDAPPALLPTKAGSVSEAQTPTVSQVPSRFAPGTDPARDRIPVERLGPSSGEPILFYDDIVLYEDELADNGSSMVNVKVRVMPSGFLVLQRFFLRVDEVLFRVFDTRLYCQFTESTSPSPSAALATTTASGAARPPTSEPELDVKGLSLGATRSAQKRATAAASAAPCNDRMDENGAPHDDDEGRWPRLIRECSGSEATYAEVKACLPPYKPHDLSPLTDANWVANSLQTISRRRFQQQQASLASGQTPRISASQFAAAPSSASGTARPGAGSEAAAAAVGGAASSPLSYLSGGSVHASRITGFPGTRPGERLDLSPARAPGAASLDLAGSTSFPSARIVGEIDHNETAGDDDEDAQWQGVGARVDVALLRY